MKPSAKNRAWLCCAWLRPVLLLLRLLLLGAAACVDLGRPVQGSHVCHVATWACFELPRRVDLALVPSLSPSPSVLRCAATAPLTPDSLGARRRSRPSRPRRIGPRDAAEELISRRQRPGSCGVACAGVARRARVLHPWRLSECVRAERNAAHARQRADVRSCGVAARLLLAALLQAARRAASRGGEPG